MTTFGPILLLVTITFYITFKLRNYGDQSNNIKGISGNIKETFINVDELITTIKKSTLDDNLIKIIIYYIMLVEKNNNLAKHEGKSYLSGNDKKMLVIKYLYETISNTIGSFEKANVFINSNLDMINKIIDEYVKFINNFIVKRI